MPAGGASGALLSGVENARAELFAPEEARDALGAVDRGKEADAVAA